MSRWRPATTDCLYVIPDIHGASGLLDKILKRILPLRKSDGIQDKIVFLGDYMDRGKDGHKVLDTLIEIKKKYKENVIFLVGNHELLLFKALGWGAPSSSFDMWFVNGGYSTVLGYIERAKQDIDPLSINPYRISDLIPEEHKKFLLNNLEAFYKIDDFVFVHGGCLPADIKKWDKTLVWDKTLNKFVPEDLYTLAWDRSLCRNVMGGINPSWDEVIVTGHNVGKGNGSPIITDKFLMLDCGSPRQLLVIELNSMEAFMAYPDKKRLIKHELQETNITTS
ncbi:hypothetical protein LCGC14_0459080 [marine sediment metagenome]|uniref:Calcineurin-like phosphoesterase domain-containing protein n=1 Tax=marine sediment metagenome TaxID=412755 RepID=A0A0F9SKQ8_9ZZZZ